MCFPQPAARDNSWNCKPLILPAFCHIIICNRVYEKSYPGCPRSYKINTKCLRRSALVFRRTKRLRRGSSGMRSLSLRTQGFVAGDKGKRGLSLSHCEHCGPEVRASAYGTPSLNTPCAPWCEKEDYWDLYYDIMEEVPESYAKHGIE